MKNVILILLLSSLSVLGQKNFLPKVAYTNSLASGVTQPIVTSFFGTNSVIEDWQFTNTVAAGTKLGILCIAEYNGFHDFVAFTNRATHVGDGVATLAARTNLDAGIDWESVWYLNNCPTGAVEITVTSSSGNHFPTAVFVGVSGNNDTPLGSGVALTNSTTDVPGMTNTVTSAANELVIGVIGAALFETSTTITHTTAGQAAVGQYFVASGDFDLAVGTNAGAASVIFGYSSSISKPQALVLFTIKP